MIIYLEHLFLDVIYFLYADLCVTEEKIPFSVSCFKRTIILFEYLFFFFVILPGFKLVYFTL